MSVAATMETGAGGSTREEPRKPDSRATKGSATVNRRLGVFAAEMKGQGSLDLIKSLMDVQK